MQNQASACWRLHRSIIHSSGTPRRQKVASWGVGRWFQCRMGELFVSIQSMKRKHAMPFHRCKKAGWNGSFEYVCSNPGIINRMFRT